MLEQLLTIAEYLSTEGLGVFKQITPYFGLEFKAQNGSYNYVYCVDYWVTESSDVKSVTIGYNEIHSDEYSDNLFKTSKVIAERASKDNLTGTKFISSVYTRVMSDAELGLGSIDELIEPYGISTEEWNTWFQERNIHELSSFKTTMISNEGNIDSPAIKNFIKKNGAEYYNICVVLDGFGPDKLIEFAVKTPK